MRCEEEAGYGGFSLGAMNLALPISAIREAVSFEELSPLPYRSRCVLGGMNLRGVVIPVVDLRLIFGCECEPLASRSVVVMAHQGRVLGLLVERVTGIFRATENDFHRHFIAPGSMTVVAGSLSRRDTRISVTVLSESLLAACPDIPMVEDPDVASALPLAAGGVGFAERIRPMMLLRCERVGLALDAISVHSTLANPPVTSSTFAVGPCHDSIEYLGLRIAAVDLHGFCGFGEVGIKLNVHAFVLQLGTGYVAFLVDEVIDVVRIAPNDVVALASYALPEPGFFSGSVPSASITLQFTAPAQRAKSGVSQYLILDAAALRASPMLLALAGMNLPIEDTPACVDVVRASATPARGSALDGAGGAAASRTLLTFDLEAEIAVLLEQVAEILPYDVGSGVFSIAGALIGLMINRGQSIPLFCLQRLMNVRSTSPTEETRVLVVQSGDDYVGFVVPCVRSIATTKWNPTLPVHAAPNTGTGFAYSRTLALVGEGPDERMLRVIDLAQTALGLRPDFFGRGGAFQAPTASNVDVVTSE